MWRRREAEWEREKVAREKCSTETAGETEAWLQRDREHHQLPDFH